MVEYAIAAGGSLSSLVGGLATSPYAIPGGIVLLLIIVVFSLKA